MLSTSLPFANNLPPQTVRSVDTFTILETTVTQLQRSHLILARTTLQEHPNTAPLLLANNLIRALNLDPGYSMKLKDLFLYYIKTADEVQTILDTNAEKQNAQKATLTLTLLMQDLNQKVRANHITKRRAQDQLAGAVTALVQLQHINSVFGDQLLQTFRDGSTSSSRSFQSTLSKWTGTFGRRKSDVSAADKP